MQSSPQSRPDDRNKKGYVPALGYHALSGLYDRVVAVTMRESVWRSRLVALIAAQPGERILDVGCGTGTLAVALKQAEPRAEITGIDPDAQIIELARQRAAVAGVTIELVHGLAQEAELTSALAGRRFDKIVSSLVFHHLDEATKRDVLGAMARLLDPTRGRLIILDWGAMPGAVTRLRFLPVRLLDGFDNTRANVDGRMTQLLVEAGFKVIETPWTFETTFGPLATWIAERDGKISGFGSAAATSRP